jgi:predicted transposase YbfD/YdcC
MDLYVEEQEPEDDFALDFLESMEGIEDLRVQGRTAYPVSEILLLVLTAVISGSESWRQIQLFGAARIDYLRKFLPFENGIPSKSTIARVMSIILPAQFRLCLERWLQKIQASIVVDEVIAIDGKTLRRSFENGSDHSAMHLVCAFAVKSGLVLGERKVDEKSNEIKAIPDLLETLNLKGNIVTIDAMGTQREIARIISEKGGDYILALKANQPDLFEQVKTLMESEVGDKGSEYIATSFKDYDKGHGRIEVRKAWVCNRVDWLSGLEKWMGLKSIVMVESRRKKGDSESVEKRFYISSLNRDAEAHLNFIRSHWGIENSLHWVLDMSFREDESKVRNRTCCENLAIVRRMAVNLLRAASKSGRYKTDRGIKTLKLMSGWDPMKVLTHVLSMQPLERAKRKK